MEQTPQQSIIQEVTRIAHHLIATATTDEQGIYWLTPAPDPGSQPAESFDLFNGSPGVILFLLTLYGYNHDKYYLEKALLAANRLLQQPQVKDPAYFTFYTGATSVLFLCLRLHQATNDHQYLEKARTLSAHYLESINTKVEQDDLLSGNAGNLLLFTHLYAYTADEYYLQPIRTLTDKLIDKARIADNGLKWDPIKHAYDSLTGFSHGVAGIAFALLQTARCFNSTGLLYLAEQALAYEMQYYDHDRNNWMDLRIGAQRLRNIHDQLGPQLASWQLQYFYPTMSDVNTWAHGAAGSGLSRLYAWEMTGNNSYLEQATAALQKGLSDITGSERGDFTLCSGYGGIAALMMETARIRRQPDWQYQTQHIALKAIAHFRQQQTYNSYINNSIADPGLFSGLSGVGYFLLSTIHPAGTASILHPIITTSLPHQQMEQYTIEAVKQRLFTRYFPNTIPLLLRQKHLDHAHINSTDNIHQLYRTIAAKITPTYEDKETVHRWETDKQTTTLWLQHKGWLSHRKRKEIHEQLITHLLTTNNDAFLQQILVTSANIRWFPNAAAAEFPYTLLYSHETGISSLQTGNFTIWILNHLQTPATPQDLFNKIPLPAATQKQHITSTLLSQLKELLQSGLITVYIPAS
ncbi:hypothetical protein KTO58_10905 [Chitinophaga pendula]|uniref:lanthionine synthetase LanC family protein n=1 Tax=Chitinophaga TaxID=79328 RepID=UPI000BAF37C3|nr:MULTISPECIES: lanthionine synthetase LanC family protein [Chitinophaga]ASZ12711.1 hypothetical protein CK934_17990 [Chitinophaga sp. MD30]UCJ09673.1 hypothetical protein KTO58_10905 [Chitinophaga pendula]